MGAGVRSRSGGRGDHAAKGADSLARTLIGWQGIQFTLPPEWNLTGFSNEAAGGYLKVDSPGTMFAQVKWIEAGGPPRRDFVGIVIRLLRGLKVLGPAKHRTPNLNAVLHSFLVDTGKAAKRAKVRFESKVKPEFTDGDRTGHNFSWSGQGQGKGKIWHCAGCGRVVIAQVVGQARDDVAGVASAMFGSIVDHAADGWHVWALYDLVAAAPAGFELKSQKLMSGHLRLDLVRRGERIRIERWALASVTLKRFTLKEWLERTCNLRAVACADVQSGVQTGRRHGAATVPYTVTSHGHPAEMASQSIAGLARWSAAIRKGRLRPAIRFEAVAWECRDTNRLYVIQVWRRSESDGLLDELIRRCECH